MVDEKLAEQRDLLHRSHREHVERAEAALAHTANRLRYLGELVEELSQQHGSRKAVSRILKARRSDSRRNSSAMDDKKILREAHRYLSGSAR